MSADSGKVIWIINHYAGSPVHGMEYRHYCLAQQFQRMGWRPVILSASFHHLLTKLPEERTADVDGVPYGLAQMLGRIVAMPKDDLREMGEWARQYVRRRRTYEVLAQQYARLF